MAISGKKTKGRKKETTEEFWSFMDQSLTPRSDKFLDHLAKELIEWARDNEDALKLSQFWLKKQMDRGTFYQFLRRHKNLEKARDIALDYIGNRRELGAIQGKYPEKTVMPYMGMFDKDHKAFIKWKNDLRKEAEKSAEKQQVIIIEKAADTTIVPIKKESDDK